MTRTPPDPAAGATGASGNGAENVRLGEVLGGASTATAGDPVDEGRIRDVLARALGTDASDAPPWRFVRVGDPARRASAVWNYEVCNADALARATPTPGVTGELAALRGAPVHIAAFADPDAASRPAADTAALTATAAACERLRLSARASGLTVAWVTRLDAAAVVHSLAVPRHWRFAGWLCMGWPATGGGSGPTTPPTATLSNVLYER